MPLSLGATLVGVIGWKSVIRNQVIGNRALERLDTGLNQKYSNDIPITKYQFTVFYWAARDAFDE